MPLATRLSWQLGMSPKVLFLYSSQGFNIVILNIALSHVYFVVAFVLLLNLFNFCAIVFVF